MKKILIAGAFSILSCTAAFSQTAPQPKHEISVGTDLFDYVAGPLEGYSIWVTCRKDQNLTYLASGLFSGPDIDATDKYGIQERWKFTRVGYARFFSKSKPFLKNLYLGANAELYQLTLVNSNASNKEARAEFLPALGPTLGYHLDLGKRWGLHLWTNPRFLLGSDDQSFIIDGHEHIHEKTTFFWGNGINVVYRFGWS